MKILCILINEHHQLIYNLAQEKIFLKYCKYCGQPVPEYGIYCSNCGARLDNTVNNNQHSYNQPIDQEQIDIANEYLRRREEGSEGAGFALGFFLGILGLIIALCLSKPKTVKGAVSGFVTGISVIIIFSFLPAFVVGCSSLFI